MDLTIKLVWITFLGFVNGRLISPPDSNHEDEIIPVDITYKHSTTEAHFVHVEVTPKGGSDVISLSLSRVKRNALPPSLLVVTEAGLVEDVFSNNSIRLQSEKTFYRDETNTSAFSIDWKDGHIKRVRGHFVRDGLLHSVISSGDNIEGQGSPRSSDSDEGHVTLSHSMSKSTAPIDLTGDAIQFSETTLNSEHRRRKRQSDGTQQLYVEYVVVTDYQNYLKWKMDITTPNMTDAEKDLTAKYNMLEFYQHVANGMDVIFKTLSSQSLQVEIVLTGLVICNQSNICPWSEKHKICPDCDTVDDKECLFEFSKWRRNVLQRLLDHDHAALFTGYDLYYKLMQSKKTVGLAYMSNMCKNGSVSLVEERRNALSIHIAAHELGHSFGSQHDGNVVAEACPEDDKYLMAPSMLGVTDPAEASHPWWFSPCSRNAIYEYIESLDSSGLNCMENIPSLYTPDDGEGDGPGLTYHPDDQCQAQYGRQSAVCREYHVDAWSSICYSMACRIPEKGECSLIYPHDGTPCGNLKWCQQGSCVYSGKTRDIDELCPLGDDPNYVCSSSDCDGTVRMRAHCCHTCRHLITVAMTTTPVTMTTPDTTKATSAALPFTTTPDVTSISMTTQTFTTAKMESTKSVLTDDSTTPETVMGGSSTVTMTTTGVESTSTSSSSSRSTPALPFTSPTSANNPSSLETFTSVVSSMPTHHGMSTRQPQLSSESAPTSQTTSTSKSVPTSQTTSTSKSVPTSQTTSTSKSVPTSQTTPTSKSAPTSQTTPTSQSVPTSHTAPLSQSALTSQTATTSQSAPTSQTTSTSKSAPTSQTTPTSKFAPTSQTTPTSKFAPTSQTTPTSKSAPTSQTTPTSQSAPTSQIATSSQSAATIPNTQFVTPINQTDTNGNTSLTTNNPLPRSTFTTDSKPQTSTMLPRISSTINTNIQTQSKDQTTTPTNFNLTTAGTNEFKNQTDKTTSTTSPIDKHLSTVNSPATSTDLNNKTDQVSTGPPTVNSISPEPASTTAGSTFTKTEFTPSASAKRSTTEPLPIPTTQRINHTSTDSIVNVTIGVVLEHSNSTDSLINSTVPNSTDSLLNIENSTIGSTVALDASKDNTIVEQTTPLGSYTVNDSTKSGNSTFSPTRNSTNSPDDNVLDKSQATTDSPKRTNKVPFDQATESTESDENMLNDAPGVKSNSNIISILTVVVLFHQIINLLEIIT